MADIEDMKKKHPHHDLMVLSGWATSMLCNPPRRLCAVGPGLRSISEASSPSAGSLQTSPAKVTAKAVMVPDEESVALEAEELEGGKHVLGRLGDGGDKATGNANGRPAKTAIGAAIERSENALQYLIVKSTSCSSCKLRLLPANLEHMERVYHRLQLLP